MFTPKPSSSGRGRAALPAVMLAALCAALPWAALAGQIDSYAYFLLRRGMSESEVLVRAGPPDLVTSPGTEAVEVRRGMVQREDGAVSFDEFRRTRIPTVTQWHYVPAPAESDPFITIITFRAGEIWEIERTKVFSRYRPKSSGAAAEGSPQPPSDTEIRRDRADKTLEAAEAYAATRAKLKEQAREEPPAGADGAQSTIYTGVQPDGSVYFGDAPP